jgi:hypothetical protein
MLYIYISYERSVYYGTYSINFVFIPKKLILFSSFSIGRTEKIDQRLGHFQKTFKLTGNEVRNLAVQRPRLITYDLAHIQVLISL